MKHTYYLIVYRMKADKTWTPWTGPSSEDSPLGWHASPGRANAVRLRLARQFPMLVVKVGKVEVP